MTDKKFKEILRDYEANRKENREKYNFYILSGWLVSSMRYWKLTLTAEQYHTLINLQIHDNNYDEFLKVIE